MTREEAIDRMKRLNLNSVDREALYTIIPELRESDDERIRKMLLELAKKHLVNHERCMAESWLEKQKEQKSETFNESYNPDDYEVVMEGNATSLKRKEQKSIEDIVKDITKDKESAIKFLKSAGIMDDNGELAEMYRSEQKPTEWSEEDEKFFELLHTALYQIKVRIGKDEYDRAVARLKSLRPQPHWKKSLATADLENSLCDLQDNYHDGSYEYKVLGEAIEFIRCTEPRPSWKPSEEQMEVLLNAEGLVRANNYNENAKILASLYEQLKKL